MFAALLLLLHLLIMASTVSWMAPHRKSSQNKHHLITTKNTENFLRLMKDLDNFFGVMGDPYLFYRNSRNPHPINRAFKDPVPYLKTMRDSDYFNRVSRGKDNFNIREPDHLNKITMDTKNFHRLMHREPYAHEEPSREQLTVVREILKD